MTDRPTGADRPNDDQDVPEETLREAGPLGRLRQFAAERFATRHEKDEDDTPGPPIAGAAGVPDELAPEAIPPTPTSYQRRVRQFRARQRRQMGGEAEEDAEDGVGPGPMAAPGPPQPPQPPPAGNWVPIGPSVLRQGQVSNQTATSGRIAGLAVAPAATRIYAAAANGGVWRSDDQGRTWRSTMDAWDLD